MRKTAQILMILALLAGCGGSGDASDEEVPPPPLPAPDPIPNEAPVPQPTALNCVPGTHLTYENFGESFLRNYCVMCHSKDLAAAQRAGAPVAANFDSSRDAALWRGGMLAKAGTDASPEPPVNNVSSLERKQFAEWLNCGAPAN